MGILDQLLGNASERNLEKLQEEFGPLLAPGETLVNPASNGEKSVDFFPLSCLEFYLTLPQ